MFDVISGTQAEVGEAGDPRCNGHNGGVGRRRGDRGCRGLGSVPPPAGTDQEGMELAQYTSLPFALRYLSTKNFPKI